MWYVLNMIFPNFIIPYIKLSVGTSVQLYKLNLVETLLFSVSSGNTHQHICPKNKFFHFKDKTYQDK